MAGKSTKTKAESLTKQLQAIKAKDLMTKDVIATTEDTTLADLAEMMIKTRISGLPVEKNGKAIGIITSTDLFALMDMIKSGEVIEDGMSAVSNPTVKFAMSTEIVKISKNTSLDEIIAIMKYRNIHTLPVFENEKMVGVIGRRDVLKKFYAVVKDLKS